MQKNYENSEIAKIVWSKLKYTDCKAENIATVIEIKEAWKLIEELFKWHEAETGKLITCLKEIKTHIVNNYLPPNRNAEGLAEIIAKNPVLQKIEHSLISFGHTELKK